MKGKEPKPKTERTKPGAGTAETAQHWKGQAPEAKPRLYETRQPEQQRQPLQGKQPREKAGTLGRVALS